MRSMTINFCPIFPSSQKTFEFLQIRKKRKITSTKLPSFIHSILFYFNIAESGFSWHPGLNSSCLKLRLFLNR
ncbi:hypothetical protein BpHYR1_016942 [Brachionus plicatilis]|uniref:Uncharacterized protein n=1 Tax=Brachionus plicatilis TaxID=10195 RepID=A0A3M7SRP8_BRAPC|nr:hypothetical protein BpHYR1_016942 [Brachionus plicatilis]